MIKFKTSWRIYLFEDQPPIAYEKLEKHVVAIKALSIDPVFYLFFDHPVSKNYLNWPFAKWLYAQSNQMPSDQCIYLLDLVYWHVGMTGITHFQPAFFNPKNTQRAFESVKALLPEHWRLEYHQPNRWFLITPQPLGFDYFPPFLGHSVDKNFGLNFNMNQKRWQIILTEIQMQFNQIESNVNSFCPNSIHLWGGRSQFFFQDNPKKPTKLYTDDALIFSIGENLGYECVNSIDQCVNHSSLIALSKDRKDYLFEQLKNTNMIFKLYHQGFGLTLKKNPSFKKFRNVFYRKYLKIYGFK